MNYMIDAKTGKVMDGGKAQWNQMGGIELPKPAPRNIAVGGTASPNAEIKDNSAVTSTIKIDQDVDITKAKLNLDIDHTYKGDLVVSLTSPSGKTAVISNRAGGSADNIKGDFDLSAFAGESSKGDWKLTVEDKAARDTGKLNSWNLAIEGNAKTPPPSADNVTKTASPNSAIKDNTTTTSTIKVDENFDIGEFKVNLDIAHTYQGDLKVTLTSPSGKSAVLHDKTGGSADNVKGEFDLSTAFAGEKVQGDWKLTVEDTARADEGTLKSWGFSAKKKGGGGPVDPPPTGGIDDKTQYSGTVEIAAGKNADGTYRLEDSSRGKGVVTYDAKNSTSPSGKTQFSDNNNVWGEAGDPARAQAGVDAQYGGQMTYDFYKNVLGRDSIDGKGEQLQSYVHVGNNYVNAYWDGTKMNYGDGNGRDASSLTTLDIAGHEITHGLTERTAGLIYRGESGGLNEAFSDIMGSGVEWYAAQKNSNVKFDWMLGEDAWTPGTPGDALRYMNDPTKDDYSIDHYSKYPQQTEVHGSSGIANNAFFLLTEGGTNRTSGQTVNGGIGMEKALKIYGRALTTYMTPSTTFAQARQATVQAATDLFGANSPEVQKVKDSWGAVGVN
jgi:subtilisin-like proprotein convertase family protein